MAVEVSLFGFGDDCPAGFKKNKRLVALTQAVGLEAFLKMAGFEFMEGLVILVNNRGVAVQDWSETRIHDNDSVKILSAIEGG